MKIINIDGTNKNATKIYLYIHMKWNLKLTNIDNIFKSSTWTYHSEQTIISKKNLKHQYTNTPLAFFRDAYPFVRLQHTFSGIQTIEKFLQYSSLTFLSQYYQSSLCWVIINSSAVNFSLHNIRIYSWSQMSHLFTFTCTQETVNIHVKYTLIYFLEYVKQSLYFSHSFRVFLQCSNKYTCSLKNY